MVNNMSTVKIGKLTEVDVRDLWKHEQYDFSNWLAKEENIKLLDDEIGLTLMDINKEVYIGSYRCDLIAKDETTGQIVIIENQLEATNHDHLGKIITYAAGLDAKTIIWIVKEAREEHKAAIEALLDNIVDEIQEKMVEYNVNGYINLLKSDHTNIDLGLMFFKTMSQLNDLDIRILKVYSNLGNDGESIVSICKKLNLELNQIRFIKEKLERFGLLQSRNEEMN